MVSCREVVLFALLGCCLHVNAFVRLPQFDGVEGIERIQFDLSHMVGPPNRHCCLDFSAARELQEVLGDRAAYENGPFACPPEVLLRIRQSDFQVLLCDREAVLVEQVYGLSLPARADRRAKLSERFSRFGMLAVAFPALNGRVAFDDFMAAQLNREALRPLSKGLLACFLSHLEMWSDIVRHGYQRAWIFEDDALPLPGVERLGRLLTELTAVDPEWHFVFTGRHGNNETWALLNAERVAEHFEFKVDRSLSENIVEAGVSEGGWGYLLSLEGARRLLAAFQSVGFLIDHDLCLHLRRVRDEHGLRLYAFTPQITTFDEEVLFSDNSEIGRTSDLLHHAHRFLAAGKVSEARRRYVRVVELEMLAEVPKSYTLMYAHEGLAHCAMDDFNANTGLAAELAETVNNRTLSAIVFGLLGAHTTHLPSLLLNFCTGLVLLDRSDMAARFCVDGVLDVRYPDIRKRLEAERRAFLTSHPKFAREFPTKAFLKHADAFLPRVKHVKVEKAPGFV